MERRWATKRAVFLALVVVMAAPALLAQQPAEQQESQAPAAKKPRPTDSADGEKLTGRPTGYEEEPAPAPKKGHPLDPRDVDILTGKYDRAVRQPYARYETPYVHVDGSASGSGSGYPRFGASQFAPVSTATSPLFVPRAFGRISGRPFVVIGTTRAGGPAFFFAARGSGRTSTFLIIP